MRIEKIILTFLCFTLLISCSSLHFYTHKEALNLAKKRSKKYGNVVIEDNNSILKVQTTDKSNNQKADETYHFDDNGKQLNYTFVASCDTCFNAFLQKELKKKEYKWRKLNDSTYISRYNLRRFLNIHTSTLSLECTKHNLSKVEHKSLIATTKK